MVEIFKNLVMEEEGQGMTEYGLILGLIAVAAIAVFGLFGDEIETIFTDILADISGATSDDGTT